MLDCNAVPFSPGIAISCPGYTRLGFRICGLAFQILFQENGLRKNRIAKSQSVSSLRTVYADCEPVIAGALAVGADCWLHSELSRHSSADRAQLIRETTRMFLNIYRCFTGQ